MQKAATRFSVRAFWRARYREICRRHPEYARPCDAKVERAHLDLWKPLSRRVNLSTLRMAAGISGRQDPEIVPEEIFNVEIEPALNPRRESSFIGYKNFYDKWYGTGTFPEVFVHNIDGAFYNGRYEQLPPDGVETILGSLEYPLVIKPSILSGGGKNVHIPANRQELDQAMHTLKEDYVIQRRMRQHEFLDRFGKNRGLNTFRALTYRSVADNAVHVLHVAMRAGLGGSLDNELSGGLVCYINPDGSLNDYAVDGYGGKFLQHPDTGVRYCGNEVVPDIAGLKELAIHIARQTFHTRVLGLDLCLDQTGRWFLTEVNIGSHPVRFAHYAGHPFLGPFLQEVIDYCRENPSFEPRRG
jgi:hypothetical protein